ncbi:unnamed protein product [Vitrella brassicaformis CCMP3155]|uniref:EF-hand domain-containing protein n=1 Tax=Vitrella brassicaformis (strain CCMP3155) TaxID=1169540 RepID=A0A0G4EPH2_VITBC|nr:unnamed protein product [Vitrella brassicaformis CCMP3155]|eukprot:CEL99361.1 unnamed protein product [Vitrella brassicaformis CCMP3155]
MFSSDDLMNARIQTAFEEHLNDLTDTADQRLRRRGSHGRINVTATFGDGLGSTDTASKSTSLDGSGIRPLREESSQESEARSKGAFFEGPFKLRVNGTDPTLEAARFREVTTVVNLVTTVFMLLLIGIGLLNAGAERLEEIPPIFYDGECLPRFISISEFVEADLQTNHIRVRHDTPSWIYTAFWLSYAVVATWIFLNHTIWWRSTVSAWKQKRWRRYLKSFECDDKLNNTSVALSLKNSKIVTQSRSGEDGDTSTTEESVTFTKAFRVWLSHTQMRIFLIWFRYFGINGKLYWILMCGEETLEMLLQTYRSLLMDGIQPATGEEIPAGLAHIRISLTFIILMHALMCVVMLLRRKRGYATIASFSLGFMYSFHDVVTSVSLDMSLGALAHLHSRGPIDFVATFVPVCLALHELRTLNGLLLCKGFLLWKKVMADADEAITSCRVYSRRPTSGFGTRSRPWTPGRQSLRSPIASLPAERSPVSPLSTVDGTPASKSIPREGIPQSTWGLRRRESVKASGPGRNPTDAPPQISLTTPGYTPSSVWSPTGTDADASDAGSSRRSKRWSVGGIISPIPHHSQTLPASPPAPPHPGDKPPRLLRVNVQEGHLSSGASSPATFRKGTPQTRVSPASTPGGIRPAVVISLPQMRASVAPPSSPAGSGGETKAPQPVSTGRSRLTPKGLFSRLNPIRVPSMAMASRNSIAPHMRIGDQLGAIVNVEDFLEETESEAIALSMRHGDSAHAAASCRARSIRAESQPSTSQPDAISMTPPSTPPSTATPSHVPTSPARNRGNVTFFPADAKGVERAQESVVQTFRRKSLVQLVEDILLPFMVLLLALALGYFVFETVQRARGSFYCNERNIKGWDQCVLKTWPLLGPLFTLQLPCNCVYLDAKEPSEPSADRLNHAIEFFSTLEGIGFGTMDVFANAGTGASPDEDMLVAIYPEIRPVARPISPIIPPCRFRVNGTDGACWNATDGVQKNFTERYNVTYLGDSEEDFTILPRHPIKKLSSQGLERQTHLRYLMGGRSELQEVPKGLRKLQNLEFMFLGFSRISEVPEWIGDLPAVRVIDLRVNDISSIPHSVVKLRDDLDCLLLHANPICFGSFFRDPSHPKEEVPKGLRKLQNLEFMFLGFSRISEVPEWIGDLPAVRVIDLRVNDISSIPHSVVKLRDDLDCLLLHANPICFGSFFRDPSHPKEFQDFVEYIHPCGVALTDAWTSECLNLCEVAHRFFLHLDADGDELVCMDDLSRLRSDYTSFKRESFVEALNVYQSEMDDCATWWTFMLFATVGATDCAECAWAPNQ